MLVLAIDTSTSTIVTGVVRDGETLSERILVDSGLHNEELVPQIQQVLCEADANFSDITAVVVGCGPGLFTGLRVGMATGAAIGDALGVPVFGVCSLDAIARRIDAANVLVTVDARRREVFWARYNNGECIAGPGVDAPSVLVEAADVVNVPEYLAAQIPAAGKRTYLCPTPASLVSCADFSSTPGPLVAQYLRRPDVKEPKQKPKSPAIPDVELD
ncbi:MAG: tRNA (adenosine(37)-N6)-threonylcarbamoyltransferase complex dimerization subunit type 1 TsaB [Corynebacterium sp.]|nr:tRNA (adenosine(37)-N6)-threonylcarbamoyltransferase complex dimerization subunit type 1 TsaB [Corynebacterium sp.]